MRPVHVAVESRERVAQTRGAPEDVRTPRDEPMPRDRAELCRYLSSRRRLTWRPATGPRRCEGSFSYILLCHSCMAILTLPACRESTLECCTWLLPDAEGEHRAGPVGLTGPQDRGG